MAAPVPDVPPPPEVFPIIEGLAMDAARILVDEPSAVIAGVIHERGTLEWKQVRLMIEQGTGEERTDRWISAILDRPAVFDLLGRGGGSEALARLKRLMDQPGRWLPVIVIPKQGVFWTVAVEIPASPA